MRSPPSSFPLASLGTWTLLLASGVASAQTAPPLNPGLWELKNASVVDGNQPVDVSAHLKSLPPEARKQMEAAMREKGIDMGAGDGSLKVCMSRESLDQGGWQGTQAGCKTEFTSRTASSWKWRATCMQPPSETVGEALFANPESYTVKTTSKATVDGTPRTVQASINARWLGDNCGGLKPMTPSSAQAPAK